MPKRTKKLLVYLDQNFISELAKADINDKVKQEWKELYQLLKEGFLFNAKTTSLQAFCDFLRDYLRSTLPANRPTISVFVLPSQSVKENAFKLFFELGAAARLFGTDEYAKIYGFDDGNMPRYELRQMPAHEVPFYGLQDVDPIKLEPGTTMEGILSICRAYCKSDHFVLIDEYRPVKDSFLVGAGMSVEAGMQTSDGCRIYAKKVPKGL